MELTLSTVGEYNRGKGNRKTRFGPRLRIFSGTKEKRTPVDNAIKNLSKHLSVFKTLNEEAVNGYLVLLKKAEQLRYMNMALLAEVIYFMIEQDVDVEQKYNDDLTEDDDVIDDLNDEISFVSVGLDKITEENVRSHIERLMKNNKIDTKSDDAEIIRLRLLATFFRYIRYIIKLKINTDKEDELKK